VAYIRKLPSGRFQATVRHPSGKKITRTDRLKSVVKQWADETEANFRRGITETEVARKTTVAEWEQRWTASRNVAATTAAKDSSRMRTHVLPKWGTWPLASISRLDVQTWVTEMTRAGVGPTTIVGSYHLLAALMKDAVLQKLLVDSPCVEIDLPTVVKPPPRWFTRLEYDRIQLALADEPRGHVWQALVALGCFSGLRWPGELAGLDVGDVHFDRGQVYVHQVLTRQGMRDYPKSDSSVRWVPFPAEVGDPLWRLCADRSQGPVFTAARGGRVNEANYRNRVWRAALKRAGVEYRDPYTMRHTAASWLVQAGVPPFEVVKMLGHSSTALVDTYLHLAPDQHDRIRAAWGSDVPRLLSPSTVD
jgi:integrase